MTQISIIVPVYNEEESLPELTTWIERVMHEHRFSYELMFINDGSSDKSWEVIGCLAQQNGHVKAVGPFATCFFGETPRTATANLASTIVFII